MTIETAPTALESLRDELGLLRPRPHRPQWRVEAAGEGFTWIFDGDRAVAMLCDAQDTFELRCAGPDSDCAPAELPKHYHIVTQVGTRIIYTWRLRGAGCGDLVATERAVTAEPDAAVVRCSYRYANGTRCQTVIRLRYDEGWAGYVADIQADLAARRVTTKLEYCNVLPAGIGDSRPGRERYTHTFWQHPDGLRRMGKNPLWWVSAAAQDAAGQRRIAEGGFLGFGPDDQMNPVIEVLESTPASGASTCDNLQDEHIYALSPDGSCAGATGWFRLHAGYRMLSIPRAMAEAIIDRAADLDCKAMLAWKFQYPALAELPDDLTGVEVPGSPFYGPSDWSKPIPWDRPCNAMLWTASPDPAAAIHYDRTVGRDRPGSIRLRAEGSGLSFGPGSGHTLHTEAGQTYRLSAWVRTEGEATGWVTAAEVLHRLGDSPMHETAHVGPDSDWTRVEATYTARGDDAPFAIPLLCAEGNGQAWFTDLAFEPID